MTGHVIGLGLESSCDETAAAVIQDGTVVLSNIISSQIDLHAEYFGVVPEIASRAHLEVINSLIDRALDEAGVTFDDLDYVAATNRPGLVGSLMVGLQSAKTISYIQKIPLIAVNHLEAHLYARYLDGHDAVYPVIGLLVSGGNTALYIIRGVGRMELLGKTGDDAVGEAYDKIAKYMKLGYPGGPIIDNLARNATKRDIRFPRLLASKNDSWTFSYSGLKTAVINYLREHPAAFPEEVSYAFQESALELLVRRTFGAARSYGIGRIVIAGGVASNSRLRELFHQEKKADEQIIIPRQDLCTDNGAMTAGIGYHYFTAGIHDSLSAEVYSKVPEGDRVSV